MTTAAERIAAAEAERDTARLEAARMRAAVTHGLTDPEDLEILDFQTDPSIIDRAAARLAEVKAEAAAAAAAAARHVTIPTEAHPPPPDPRAEFARQLFGR